MEKLLKLLSIFGFWLTCISLEEIAANAQNTPTTSSKIEYYKTLARSGFLNKSKKAKYVASIKRLDIETSYAEHHICTGAVISESRVLAAAECTYDEKRPLEPKELTVVVGIQYGSMYDQFAQVMAVEKIRRHSNYNPGHDDYNLAIILLNDSIVPIGDSVYYALIATKPPLNYELCTSVGFGVLYYKDTKLSQILEGELKVWPMSLCESYLKLHGKAEKTGFCAGDLRDLSSPPCKIIASEPLFCRDILYGIALFSIGCESNRGFASVYANVWEYDNWITQHAEILRDKAHRAYYSKFLVLTMLFAFFYGMFRKY